MSRTLNPTKQSKPRRPSIQHFQKLDQKSKEEDLSSSYPKYKGEMVRFHAIEWLRLECVQRFYSSLKSPPENTVQRRDLNIIKSGKHHWLVGLGAKPLDPNERSIRAFPSFAQEKFAVILIKPGEKGFARGRGHISIDWEQDDDVIKKGVLEAKQHALKSSRKSESSSKKSLAKKVRGKGGGRKYSLAQLYEALSLYDKYQIRKDTKKKIKQSALCYEAKTFGKTQGEKVISHVRKMIDTAGQHPTSVFHEIFG